MLLGICWVCHPRHVVKIQCWYDVLFVIFWLLFAKRAPPANFGSALRTNGMDYRNIPWVCLSHGFIDHVYRFLCDLKKICRKSSKKCVSEIIQDGGKSILAQMGVAYMERCVSTQGIQGEKNFHFPTHGSKVTGQNVKFLVIAPPCGRVTLLFFD